MDFSISIFEEVLQMYSDILLVFSMKLVKSDNQPELVDFIQSCTLNTYLY